VTPQTLTFAAPVALWPCSIAELAAKSGLPQSELLDLVARYPAMATLDTAGGCDWV
jgi:hypothetical protein